MYLLQTAVCISFLFLISFLGFKVTHQYQALHKDPIMGVLYGI